MNSIVQFGTRALGRSLLVTKKFSPEILTAVGVVGVVASGILAARATLKLEAVVENITEGANTAKMRKWTASQDGEGFEYSDQDYTKDITTVYTRGTIELVKLYGPSVTLGLASIGCIIGAHGIMRKRNVALLAAYKAIEQTFSEYRKRVIEDYGVDKDAEYRLGLRDVELVGDDGKKTVEKVVDPNALSPYTKIFDELNPNWRKIPEYNLLWLRGQQNFANDMLHARGHIFLNDVLDLLDIERTSAGAIVGWVISKTGDNFVDFGIYDVTNSKAVNHSTSRADSAFILDFNVDGVIYDKI